MNSINVRKRRKSKYATITIKVPVTSSEVNISEDVKDKLVTTVDRIINKGKGGLICILLDE